MEYCGITDRGIVRKINQDVCLMLNDEAKGATLLVVCDGMGGAKAGNIASAIASETFIDYMKEHMAENNNMIETMQHISAAVREANRKVYEKSMADSDCAGMGTTLVAAVIINTGVVIANVGDSRAYHITSEKIIQVTKDHSVVEDMIDRGDLTRSEASSHPNRNLITRALGTALDTEPDFFFLNLLLGEHLLLCSDGLSNIVSEQTMQAEINVGPDTQSICQRLINLAIDQGAPDNVTVIIYQK